MKTLSKLCTVVALMMTLSAGAADWPNWRGPNHNGSVEAKNLPAKFSKTENVKWSIDLPGPAGATPIIIGDRIFLSTVDVANQQLLAVCLDRKTGKTLWSENAGSGHKSYGSGSVIALEGGGPGGGTYSNYASPSPVTDGKNIVVFFYGNGDLTAFDYQGERLWTQNIQQLYGDFAFQWTFSSSPTMYKGKLYLPVLQRDTPAHGSRGREGSESFILCLDPKTGNELWKHVRPTSAIVESREAYTTLIPYTHNGREQLLLSGGDILSSHDPETGKELWRWGSYNPDHREQWWRLVPSAVAGEGVALVCAPKRAPAYAIRIPDSPGEATEPAWISDGRGGVASDVPTPAFADGSFFILNDQGGTLSRVNPKNGEVAWECKLGRTRPLRSSPTVADGKVYFMDYAGKTFVVDAGSGKLLNEVDMGEEDDGYTPASIAVAHDQIFIRTQGKLYCIGN